MSSRNSPLISSLSPTEICSFLPWDPIAGVPPPSTPMTAFGKFCLVSDLCWQDQKCSPRPLFPPAWWSLRTERVVHGGDGVGFEERVGSEFLNPATPNSLYWATAWSQGEWLSVVPNIIITCLFLFITQRIPTRKSERLGSKSHLYYSPAVWSWTSYLTSVSGNSICFRRQWWDSNKIKHRAPRVVSTQ